jgi:hypothetical protein
MLDSRFREMDRLLSERLRLELRAEFRRELQTWQERLEDPAYLQQARKNTAEAIRAERAAGRLPEAHPGWTRSSLLESY